MALVICILAGCFCCLSKKKASMGATSANTRVMTGTSAKAGGRQRQPNAAIDDAHEPAKSGDTAAAAGTAEPSCSVTTGREARPHLQATHAGAIGPNTRTVPQRTPAESATHSHPAHSASKQGGDHGGGINKNHKFIIRWKSKT